MNYMNEIRKKFRRLLKEHEFEESSIAMFERIHNDVRQAISFDHHREYKRISWGYTLNDLCQDSYHHRNMGDFFYENDEEFYQQLDKIYLEIEEILPLFDEIGKDYCMNRTVVYEFNNHREMYIEQYVELHDKFPENINELVENLKKDYEGKQEVSKAEKDRLICMGASVYFEYLRRKHPEWKTFGGTRLPICFLTEKRDKEYEPFEVTFYAFMTKDFDGFYTGQNLYYPNSNGEIVKNNRIVVEQKLQ